MGGNGRMDGEKIMLDLKLCHAVSSFSFDLALNFFFDYQKGGLL